MPQTLLPGLGLNYEWDAGADGWKAGNDKNLVLLNRLALGVVIDQLAAPPGSPVQGDAYIVIATATGLWTGQETNLAIWDDNNSVWRFTNGPETGWQVYDQTLGGRREFNGATWPAAPGGGGTDADAIHDNVAGEITAITEKVTPAPADVIIIEDSAAADVKKRVEIGNLPSTDADAIHDNVAGEITAITEKVTPVAADVLIIEDSADSDNKKRVEIGNLPGGGGKVVQRTYTQDGEIATGTTTIPDDDSIPQSNEGIEFMTLAHTPEDALNILKIDVVCVLGRSTSAAPYYMTASLFQDAIADALASAWGALANNTANGTIIAFSFEMVAGTISEITFKVRGGNSTAGTTRFNGSASGRKYGGVMASSITITEYRP